MTGSKFYKLLQKRVADIMPSSNNSRIAKNTLFLYFRMIFIMLVSLFTSRVVLAALGVESFGVYNVVGGVVASLSFLNSSLGASTQRFLNYEMGLKDNADLSKIFSNAVNAHIIIGIVTLLLLETAGLWFVLNKLDIPESNLQAAFWVYQASIASVFITVISTPYNAAIVAHERMGVFAYFSILECLLKLGVVYLLLILPFDRLLVYGLLLLGVTAVMQAIYVFYCIRKFNECSYHWNWDKSLVKKMFSFTGWMFFGCITDMLSGQGINMLVNIFFGPVFNASRAIAYQVFNAVHAFLTNFMTAVKPQIVKSYAANNKDYAFKLVFSSTKLSFYLLFFLTMPLFLHMDLILKLWLKNVPEMATLFTRLVLVDLWIRAIYTPMAQINQASGKIRSYQLAISIIFLLIFVFTLVLFEFGLPVYYAFIVSIVMNIIGIFTRLAILRKENGFPIAAFVKKAVLPLIPIALITFLIPHLLITNFNYSVLNIIVSTILGEIGLVVSIWFIGLNNREKEFIADKVSKLRRKI